VELRNALNDKFAVELSPTVTLDYPSVAALAAHIAEQLSQAAGVIESDDEVQVGR
jgi:acyl carrier protein